MYYPEQTCNDHVNNLNLFYKSSATVSKPNQPIPLLIYPILEGVLDVLLIDVVGLFVLAIGLRSIVEFVLKLILKAYVVECLQSFWCLYAYLEIWMLLHGVAKE